MDQNKTTINWFPGHMAKARREISEKLGMVDVVVEILDARIPYSSQNPMLQELLKNKKKLIILNKASLADKKATEAWINTLQNENTKVLDIDLITDYNVKRVIPSIRELMKEDFEKKENKGVINKKIRVLVVGIPNVGKSTFINKLAKRKAAKTGDKPGVTKSQVWIKIEEDIDLLDTPGILWPKFDSDVVAKNLAVVGSIKDEVLPLDEVCSYALLYLQKYYLNNLNNRYGTKIEEDTELLDIYEEIGRKRGCILRGNEVDYERVINLILYDLRHEKLGEITYDRQD